MTNYELRTPQDTQVEAIQTYHQIAGMAARDPRTRFPQSASAHIRAVDLLALIAHSDSPHADAAAEVLAFWRSTLATGEQIARVQVTKELEVAPGAVASVLSAEEAAAANGQAGYDPTIHGIQTPGFWIQTWTWISDDDTTL